MVNLKATIRIKTKTGLYPVYIRFTKSNQVSYVKSLLRRKDVWTGKRRLSIFMQLAIQSMTFGKQVVSIVEVRCSAY